MDEPTGHQGTGIAVLKPQRLYSRKISANQGPSSMRSPSVTLKMMRSSGKLCTRAASSVVRMQCSAAVLVLEKRYPRRAHFQPAAFERRASGVMSAARDHARGVEVALQNGLPQWRGEPLGDMLQKLCSNARRLRWCSPEQSVRVLIHPAIEPGFLCAQGTGACLLPWPR